MGKYQAAFNALIRDLAAWGGVGTGLLGWYTHLTGLNLILPSSAWLTIAALLSLVAAFRAYYRLEQEKTRKPRPDISLGSVVERIAGPNEWNTPGASPKISDAFVLIREKSRLGALSVWGRKSASQHALDMSPTELIPPEHWTNAHIDFLQYLKDKRCATQNAKHPGAPEHYSDLQFNTHEIDALWPKKSQRKFVLQLPFAWR